MYNGEGGGGYDHYDSHQGPPPNAPSGRVRVEDALSYLDQVKTQFLNEPAVYTQFLDIMKDFKSQAIDTPGVITRVSQLFNGRPRLITGFNTFLPSGFEVKVEGSRITVKEPSGSIKVIFEGDGEPMQMMDYEQSMQQAQPMVMGDAEVYDDEGEDDDETEEIENDEEDTEEQEIEQLSHDSDDDEATPEPTPAETGFASHSTAPQGLQLNTAIGYVNKIKARYMDRPHVYKQFLEILHSYQERLADQTSTPNTEEAVLQAVASLFADEPDLLTDFRLFLPDVHGLHRPAEEDEEAYYSDTDEAMTIHYGEVGYYGEGGHMYEKEEDVSTEEGEEEDEGGEDEEGEADREGESEDEEQSEVEGEEEEAEVDAEEESEVEGDEEEAVETKEEEQEEEEGESGEDEFYVEDFPMPLRDIDMTGLVSKINIEDLAFFDKVRRVVKSSEYDTFLRAISLYSTGVVSARELLAILQPIIGGYSQLLNQMRLRFFPGESECEEAEPVPETPDPAAAELQHQIDYASCKQLGVSYRSLPEGYQRPVCTGRTPLCMQVLNDTWVSFPSWSSEDSSCVSSKKTQYEDFVYRTEDERFELDIIIEVNKYAIEALESVRRKMCRLSTLEQEKYRLDDKLGGSSASLMNRAVKRIYGEHSTKLVESLKRNPLITVPKAIERMREKEREWFESQNQMNRIWREQNEKHMVRAMDHQSTSLKTSDAKWIKAKQMITQIEQLFDERQQKSEEGLCDDMGPHVVMTYPEDRSVLRDASDLIIHYVKRQSNIPKDDKKKIKRLLRTQVNEWLFVECEDMSDVEDNSSPPVAVNGHVVAAGSSCASSDDALDADDVDLKEGVELIGTTRSRLIYGGNALFVFFRIHQVMCDRLGKIKKRYTEMLAEYQMEQDIREQQAEIYKKHGKTIHSHEHNASDTCNGLADLKNCHRNPTGYYEEMVAEIKNLLDSQIEPNNFEDNLRTMFPNDGYLLFTIDKLISVVARQLHQLVTDNDGCATLRMYNKYRVERPFSVYDQSDRRLGIEGEYSTAAESQMDCLNCFKIFVVDEDRPVVTIELVDTETGENGDEERSLQQQQAARLLMERAREAINSSTASSEDDDNDDEVDGSGAARSGRRLTGTRTSITGISTGVPVVKPSAAKERKPQLVVEKSPVFLRRNVELASRREDTADKVKLASKFISVDSTVVVSQDDKVEGARMVSNTYEGIFRRQRASRADVMADLERMNYIRRCRAGDFWPEERGATWLSQGVVKVVMKHPEYPFLVYNRYLSKHPDSLTESI